MIEIPRYGTALIYVHVERRFGIRILTPFKGFKDERQLQIYKAFAWALRDRVSHNPRFRSISKLEFLKREFRPLPFPSKAVEMAMIWYGLSITYEIVLENVARGCLFGTRLWNSERSNSMCCAHNHG
jgi:hypothetical protein